ncbi:hypothetical protein HHI36_003845 [Cryptolaemus montrouzieri]|uniref:Uncharacterized protein n=1 Tax=Cryptolaemus montrouzieri TaxID=559131 RepID=A0ABD2NPF1_9CUCU
MVISHHTSEKNMAEMKYIGNNIRICITKNTKSLLVVGNNIEVNIENHLGHLKIIGCNCKVRIASGNGKIFHVGNNGKFRFASPETRQNFEYNGNNISIKTAGKTVACEENEVTIERTADSRNGAAIFISNAKNLTFDSSTISKKL